MHQQQYDRERAEQHIGCRTALADGKFAFVEKEQRKCHQGKDMVDTDSRSGIILLRRIIHDQTRAGQQHGNQREQRTAGRNRYDMLGGIVKEGNGRQDRQYDWNHFPNGNHTGCRKITVTKIEPHRKQHKADQCGGENYAGGVKFQFAAGFSAHPYRKKHADRARHCGGDVEYGHRHTALQVIIDTDGVDLHVLHHYDHTKNREQQRCGKNADAE